ncbi:MAG TPA: hemolytic protein HlpA [Ruminococcaceae bacterium]|nr:hemolytic protein HlpA [Oscillospiraceae bacterium]
MDYFDIPVALFLFKRKSTALQIIEKISQVRPLKIYILSDEGRTSVERKLVSNVRKSVEEAINWECEIIKNYANENRGVYANIALGAKWVFEHEEMAIFLEDDNLPEVSFFGYCKELLEKYKDDSRVLWICGTNYLGKYEPQDGSSYMFTKHLLPCGWASWGKKFNEYYDYNLKLLNSDYLIKRVKYEYHDKRLYEQQMSNVELEKYKFDHNIQYMSWDYHMAWSCRVNNVYGISPKYNQIKNIGVDEFSAHGGNSMNLVMTKRFCGMESYNLELPLKHPQVVLTDIIYEKKTGNIILLPLKVRIKLKLRKLIGKAFYLPPSVSITKSIVKKIKKGKNRND